MPSRVSDRALDRSTPGSEPRERRRHKSGRTKRKSSSRDGTEHGVLDRSSVQPDTSTRRTASMAVPELQRRNSLDSPNASKTSLPYPSFSKAHSREAVNSKENLSTPPRRNVFTPDFTDFQQRQVSFDEERAKRASTAAAVGVNGPPSPPLTADNHVAEENIQMLEKDEKHCHKGASFDSEEKKYATSSPRKNTRAAGRSSVSSLRNPRSTTPVRVKDMQPTVQDGSTMISKTRSRSCSPLTGSKVSVDTTGTSGGHSQRTSVAPTQPTVQIPFSPGDDDEDSPPEEAYSTPTTITPTGTPFSAARVDSPASAIPMGVGRFYSSEQSPIGVPPPPPPPPPPVLFQAPRVDYLMQHGGLNHTVPKTFLTAPNPVKPIAYTVGEMPNPTAMAAHVDRFFAPFSNILDDYNKVMEKGGSVAVATGYRSVARRLLDRLEAVFARDISCEACACIMCDSVDNQTMSTELGVSWGEVLEYVCGRRELPPWPPFHFEQHSDGPGISVADVQAPMQKLDVDVPEEYREHYIRQSKKTKQSVDRWLVGQFTNADNPPDEADDDTLTFAILTHLEPDLRPIFNQILGVATSRPPSIRPGSRAQSTLNAPTSDLLSQTGFAIQRLYRLPNLPRAPERALYLVKNPTLHNVLATLAAISDGEWDILISGRFDGFLRSGAEDVPIKRTSSSVNPSRGPTPASSRPSFSSPGALRPNTPAASAGAPVAMDEETEIAVLAEVEREIYLGMEALEDAFEALHLRAEGVRSTLRERGAGLSMSAQARKGGAANVLEARLGTPASVNGWDGDGGNAIEDGMGTDSPGFLDDGMSEIAPDDSASNVSSSRHRRPKRRNERRTPALVEEEGINDGGDEAGGGGGGGGGAPLNSGEATVRERERESQRESQREKERELREVRSGGGRISWSRSSLRRR